jgi:hypothetical protein
MRAIDFPSIDRPAASKPGSAGIANFRGRHRIFSTRRRNPMPLLNRSVTMVARRMPKVITPRAHAIIDYAVAASFVVAGVNAWRHHKHAAISAFIVAGAKIGLSLMTDYPGGIARVVPFPTHLRFDAGNGGLVSSMPNLMGFGSGWPAWIFRAHGVGIAAVAALTSAGEEEERVERAA